MCANCLEYFSMLWNDFADYPEIETQRNPLFKVTVGRRMVACNKKAEEVLRKSKGDMTGLLCGEFLGCERSHLPEGCGLTAYCDSCAIRRALAVTADTGVAQERVMAFLHAARLGTPEFLSLMVSTRKAGDLVELELAGL